LHIFSVIYQFSFTVELKIRILNMVSTSYYKPFLWTIFI